VLTHPERNPLLQRRADPLLQWAEEGVVMQVTANSFTGYWGKAALHTVRWLLEHNAVHVVASDAHDPKRRPPVLSAARKVIAELRGEEVAEALVNANPGAVIRGEELPYFPVPGEY
jgi:protein-tyrosine phosphatase